MGTSRYTNYEPVKWDVPIWSPDWKQVDSLLTNQEQGYQLAQQALNAPIDSSSYGNDPLLREQLRLNRDQAQADLATTYTQNGIHSGNKALQSYIQQIQREKQPGGIEYQLMQNKAAIKDFNEKIDKAEGWSPEKKAQWFALNMTGYKGSLQDETLKGFSGQDISKFINGAELAQKLFKEMIPKTTEGIMIDGKISDLNTGGRTVYYDSHGNGFWDEGKKVSLTPEDMIMAVKPAMDTNPEWQAYSKDNSKIGLFQQGLTKENFKPLVESRKQVILSQLDAITNTKDKKALVSQLSGTPISELSKYKPEEIDAYIQKQKDLLELEGLKFNNINSYDDLIKYKSDEDLNAIVKGSSQIYKRDDLAINLKNVTDHFGIENLKESYRKKAAKEEKLEIPLDPASYWWGTNEVFRTKLGSEFIESNNTYKELVNNFIQDSKGIATQFAIINNDFNVALKDPKNLTGQLLKEAGFNPEVDGDFIKFHKDEKSGIISIEKTNWDKLKLLDGDKQQKITALNAKFDKQAATLNEMINNQYTRIDLYQKRTGDLNIFDNLQDNTETSFLDEKGVKVNQPVSYKTLGESNGQNPLNTVKIGQELSNVENRKILYDEYIKRNPSLRGNAGFSSFNDFESLYKKYPDLYNISKNPNPRGNFQIDNGNNRKEIALSDVRNFTDFIDKKYNSNPEFIDKTYKEKEDKYQAQMKNFDGVILSPGRSYTINALALDNKDDRKTATDKANNLALMMGNSIKSYITTGKTNDLIYLNGMQPITDKDELGVIGEAVAGFKPEDVDNPDKTMQKNNVSYSVKFVNGKMYGVASIIFDKEMEIGGETQKGTNVAFEINNNNSDLKSFLLQHEQLASEIVLQQEEDINNQLQNKTVASVKYPIPGGPTMGIKIAQNISVSDNSTGVYKVNLFPDVDNQGDGRTSNVTSLETNNPYLGTELGNYFTNLSLRKNDFALLTQLKFNGDSNQTKQLILKEVQEKAPNITQTQLNEIWERFIYPRIKDGKAPDIQGNFTVPQQSLIQFK